MAVKKFKNAIDETSGIVKIPLYIGSKSVNSGRISAFLRFADWHGGTRPMNLRPSHREELFSVIGLFAIAAVTGCSSLNANRSQEPALSQSSANATHAQAEVGLPGVIESAETRPQATLDPAVSQSGYQPAIGSPELQQKFNNLQNRFQTRVDQSQVQLNQSIMKAQEQARTNLQRTESAIQNQAEKFQNQAMTEAQKAQAAAQQRYTQLQSQAQKKIVSPIQQSAQKVEGSLNQAAEQVGQATDRATQATGRFFDSLLPESSLPK